MSLEGYFREAKKILQLIENTQKENIYKASDWIADSLAKGGVLHIFGSGHSNIIVQETFHRAGGLVPVNGILEQYLTPLSPPGKAGNMERLEGLAEIIIDYYDLRPGEVLIVISNSGINAVPVEMALGAKKRSLRVVAITSLNHSKNTPSRHSSGKRLFEIADLVIDNCGPKGDAMVKVEGLRESVGPTSTLAGIFIMEALVCQVVVNLVKMGIEPPVFLSANIEGGREHNKELIEKYGGRIKLL